MSNKLEALLGHLSKNEFDKHYKENKPFHIEGLDKSLSELKEIGFLKSLDDLLNFWPTQVEAMLPGICDEANTKIIDSNEARDSFKEGMSLLFNDANNLSPVLSNWVESLIFELGLSRMTYGRNLIYATPASKGNAPHFDQNINFVLQLHGEKKWWVAPNTHVENPLTRHVIGQPIDPELESYAPEMPSSFPENSEEFTLKAGSMLFVPRGAWHKTEAITDALSLNFTFSSPSWIDVLSAALRGRLAMSKDWRETADFVSDPSRQDEAMIKLDQLLSELAQDVSHWNAKDILGATEGQG
ncbi:MAG: cupin-like domain-containing protein [Bacteriovoracaceae bacterium]|nr:cupin-like domain-containing protein [Bacteriovoracaceae bacterium]